MVPLRAVRDALGLTTPQLALRIAEFGVDVHPDSLINVELGRKSASNELITAWAKALNLSRADIRRPAELRELLADDDEPEARSA